MTQNLYKNDRPMITSGKFWRCKHGLTMFTDAICVRCALAAPVAFYRAKLAAKAPARKPRAWITISRYGQITSRPRVHVGLYGSGRGCIGLYTYADDPPGNATAESNANAVASLVGIPVYDERKTPWDVPRDGLSELTVEMPQRRDQPA